MKTSAKILLIILSLVVSIIFLAERSVIRLSNSKNNQDIKVTSKWEKSLGRMGDSLEIIPKMNVSIIIKHGELVVGDTEAIDPLEIDISNVNFDSGWNPFCKQIKLDFQRAYQYDYAYNSNMTRYTCNCKGNFKYVGEYEVKGLFSTRKFENETLDVVMNKIYNSVKSKISEIYY